MAYEDVVAAYRAIPKIHRTWDVLNLMEEMRIIHASNARGEWHVAFARIPHAFQCIENGTGIPFPETQTVFECFCHPDMDEPEPEGGWDNWVCPCCKNNGWVEKQPNGEYLPYQP